MILITFPRSCVNLIDINRSFLKPSFLRRALQRPSSSFLWNGLNHRPCIGSFSIHNARGSTFLQPDDHFVVSPNTCIYLPLLHGTETSPDASFIYEPLEFSRASQSVKSPIRSTAWHLGAQTRKVKPSCSPLVSFMSP